LFNEHGLEALDALAKPVEREPHELQQCDGDEHDDVHARDYRRLRVGLQPRRYLPRWGIGDRLKVGQNLTRFD
jgi:hypothetical protein